MIPRIEAWKLPRCRTIRSSPLLTERHRTRPFWSWRLKQPNPDDDKSETQRGVAIVAKQARALTVAKLIKELNTLKRQMFEDEAEYNRLRAQYTSFLTFTIADERPDLKLKVLAIRGSTRHIRLAQELRRRATAANSGRSKTTGRITNHQSLGVRCRVIPNLARLTPISPHQNP